jgi:hypothetical protein
MKLKKENEGQMAEAGRELDRLQTDGTREVDGSGWAAWLRES